MPLRKCLTCKWGKRPTGRARDARPMQFYCVNPSVNVCRYYLEFVRNLYESKEKSK